MKRLFAVMPFGKHNGPLDYERADIISTIDFDGVWTGILQPAIPEEFITKRADELGQSGLIDQIYSEWLYEADIVLADLTLGNPNVYYELGIRQALSRRGTVLVACEGTRLPFDVRNQSIIHYDYFNLAATIRAFQDRLSKVLRNAIAPEFVSPVHVFIPGIFVARYGPGLNPEEEVVRLTERIEQLEAELKLKNAQEDNLRWMRMIQEADTAASVTMLRYIATQERPSINVLELLSSRLKRFGKVEEALVILGLANEAKPNDPAILRELGILYQRKGPECFREAEHYMEQALDLNDGDVELHGMIGDLLRIRGEYRDALSHCKRAYSLDAENFLNLVNLGSICAALKDIAESLRWYQLAKTACQIRISSGNSLVYLCLAEAAVAEGDCQGALVAFGRIDIVTEAELRSAEERLTFLMKIGFAGEGPAQVLGELQARLSKMAQPLVREE